MGGREAVGGGEVNPIAASKFAQRAYRRRKSFGNAVSEMFVTKTRRGVRITVVAHLDRFEHSIPRPFAPGTGFADLDDEQLDRLVRRLTNIKGGKRRSHTRNGHKRTA